MEVIDCEGFAGGFTLGMVQAGFTLVGKRELPGGFGVPSCEANRHLLGDGWTTEIGPAESWTPKNVPVVFGNPPCSGFSLMSRPDFRGSASPVNACMHALIEFAARCDPQVVAFESVQQAYKQGRDLMTTLRDKLESLTGHRYTLYHVLHNAASLGGAAIRRRYFFLASRVPFGIEQPHVDRVPLVRDTLGDLTGLGVTWERQPYRRPPTWWSHDLRSPDHLVDGHMNKAGSLGARRITDLIALTDWAPREIVSVVARRAYREHGSLPDSWANLAPKLIASDFKMGFMQVYRWSDDRVARVVTGSAVHMVVHPTEPRTLTNREVARVQGFPDDWRIKPLTGPVHAYWGKGIPVQSGRWVGTWIKRALEGTPGTDTGVPDDGDRERRIDCTENYRRACTER